jgi:hypothetical protein
MILAARAAKQIDFILLFINKFFIPSSSGANEERKKPKAQIRTPPLRQMA